MKIKCFLLGHKDPVMLGLEFEKQSVIYEKWKTWERNCLRCGCKINNLLYICKKIDTNNT